MYGRGKLNCNIPQEFVVGDLAKLLNFISLFDDECQINLYDHYLTVDNRNEQFKMNYTPDDLIIKPNRDEEISLPSSDAEFELSKEVLAKIFKACNIIGVTDLFFDCQVDGTVIVIGQNTRDTSSDNYNIELKGVVKNHVECNIKVEDLKILPDSYKVAISSEGAAEFNGHLGQTYFIGVEVL